MDRQLIDLLRANGRASYAELARQVTAFVQDLRKRDLYKVPGVAETLDWTAALVALDQKKLEESIVAETLGVILKYQDDVEKVMKSDVGATLARINVMG